MLDKVKLAMTKFCVHTVAGASGSESATLVGKPAIDAKHKAVLENEASNKGDTSFQDLEVFHMYKWLLDGGQWAEIQKLTEALMMPLARDTEGISSKTKKGRKGVCR